jgi:hypothetical protein
MVTKIELWNNGGMFFACFYDNSCEEFYVSHIDGSPQAIILLAVVVTATFHDGVQLESMFMI